MNSYTAAQLAEMHRQELTADATYYRKARAHRGGTRSGARSLFRMRQRATRRGPCAITPGTGPSCGLPDSPSRCHRTVARHRARCPDPRTPPGAATNMRK